MAKNIHEGHNVKRFREMPGIKQHGLAFDLGDDWTQKKISMLEQKENIEPALLQQIATVLKTPVEAFQNFNEEQAINIISNTFDNGSIGYNRADTQTFNPIERIVQLHEEKISFYERMLKGKEDIMSRLERLIEQGKGQ